MFNIVVIYKFIGVDNWPTLKREQKTTQKTVVLRPPLSRNSPVIGFICRSVDFQNANWTNNKLKILMRNFQVNDHFKSFKQKNKPYGLSRL